MNNKLLDDAKAAGFYVSDEGFIFHFDGFDINRQLAKFAALQIPDGYKIVPIEDTEYMNDMGFKAYQLNSTGNYTFRQMISCIYQYMIDASPPINTEVT